MAALPQLLCGGKAAMVVARGTNYAAGACYTAHTLSPWQPLSYTCITTHNASPHTGAHTHIHTTHNAQTNTQPLHLVCMASPAQPDVHPNKQPGRYTPCARHRLHAHTAARTPRGGSSCGQGRYTLAGTEALLHWFPHWHSEDTVADALLHRRRAAQQDAHLEMSSSPQFQPQP